MFSLGQYIPEKYLWKAKTFLQSTFGASGSKVFSEFGEDLILDYFFANQAKGFYVDIGANHPVNQSNTYKLYKRGWRGINVDASPVFVGLLNSVRSKDTNIQALVSDVEGEQVSFCDFGVSDMNTADETRAIEVQERIGRPYSKVSMKTRTLASLLKANLPKGTEIDLLTVDAEANDLKILKSNDWKKFRPKVVLVEFHFQNLKELLNSEIYLFMENLEYELVNITGPTLIFISKVERNYKTWPFIRI